MAENTRKAVVTLAQVTAAFAAYVAVKAKLGESLSEHTFDRGNRGKGFAQYDGLDRAIRTFDTKEDALTFYSRYVEVATEVMEALGHDQTAPESAESAEGTVGTQEGQNAPEGASEAVTVPSQRRRVKASQEAK